MPQRKYPNSTILPGSVPDADRVVWRTDDVLIAIKNVQVYREGLSFDLWTFSSPVAKPTERGMFATPNGTPADGGLGVEVLERSGSIEVSRAASIQGGGGSDTRQIVTLFAELDFASHDEKGIRIRTTWPELGIDESYELLSDVLLTARNRAISFITDSTR